jgi:hypothetical protein
VVGWNNGDNVLIILTAQAGGFSGFFAYSPAPGPGNLIMSYSASAGVDPYENAYKQGFELQGAGDTGQAILFGVSGGVATITFFTGTSFEGTQGVIKSGTIGTGAAEQLQLDIAGPATNVTGAKDLAGIILQSNNEGGTSNAQGELFIQSTLGVLTTMLNWAPTGVEIFQMAQTATELPSGFTGNFGLSKADVTTVTVTAAAQTQLTIGYSIPAGDAAVDSTYILKTSGTGTQGSTAETLTIAAGFGVLGTTGTGITFPATFAAISTAFRWSSTITARCVTTGATATWQVTCEATVTSAAGNSSGTSTNATAITQASNAAIVVSGSAAWGATTGAPTLSSYGSYFQKIV